MKCAHAPAKQLLLIDNYDSFTYNIVHALQSLNVDVKVVMNDEAVDIDCNPDYLVISPGPGNPDESGLSLQLITRYAGVIPILGVCLGHQCIGQLFGGKVVRAKAPVHGKTSLVHHNNQGLFKDIPSPFIAARYHSLVVERETLPDCLEITAETEEGEIMGLRHKELPIEGVQFHPESVASEWGEHLFNNFLERNELCTKLY